MHGFELAFSQYCDPSFPNAKIVADRFHVIRLVIDTFLDFCRSVDPDIRWQRGITRALRTKGERLKAVQKTILEKLFSKTPVIETAYKFKEELCCLLNMKQQTKEKCRPLIRRFKEMMRQLHEEAPPVSESWGVRCGYGLSLLSVCGASVAIMESRRVFGSSSKIVE